MLGSIQKQWTRNQKIWSKISYNSFLVMWSRVSNLSSLSFFTYILWGNTCFVYLTRLLYELNKIIYEKAYWKPNSKVREKHLVSLLILLLLLSLTRENMRGLHRLHSCYACLVPAWNERTASLALGLQSMALYCLVNSNNRHTHIQR